MTSADVRSHDSHSRYAHRSFARLHFFDKWYQQATKSPTELGEEDIRNLQVEYLSKFGWTLAPSGGASGNQTCHDARTGNTFDVGGANPNAVLSDVTPRYIIVPDAAALADRISDDMPASPTTAPTRQAVHVHIQRSAGGHTTCQGVARSIHHGLHALRRDAQSAQPLAHGVLVRPGRN